MFKKFTIKNFDLYFVIITLLIAFLLGYWVGQGGPEEIASPPLPQVQDIKEPKPEYGEVLDKDSIKEYLLKDVEFNLFWDVWNLLQRRYVDRPIQETTLFYGALNGMVNALNLPYTVFLDPNTYKEFSSDLEGNFEGIGAEIGLKKGILVIIAPLPKSPAENTGLRPGDIVLEIDHKDTTGIALDQAVKWIRGKKGTSVLLKIFRKEWDAPKEITIIRDTINVESVAAEIRDNLMIIKVSHFNADTMTLFNQAAEEALSKKVKGVIVDLRGNPGGYLDGAIEMGSFWVRDDVIVIEKFSDGRERKYRSKGPAKLEKMKTVILVNEGSASASEIVAGALKDYKKASIVGKKTFGKGSVQVLEELKDGSALKITVAKWLTPSRKDITEQGIEPDILVDKTEKDYEEEKDPQLDKAMSLF